MRLYVLQMQTISDLKSADTYGTYSRMSSINDRESKGDNTSDLWYQEIRCDLTVDNTHYSIHLIKESL